jgi:hypothetical protein
VSIASGRPETNGLLAALQAAHSRVGDAVAPDDTTTPYAVLYPAGSGSLTGSVARPHEDRPGLYQITCVGKHRQEAEWLAEKLRAVVLGPLSITGRRVLQASLETSQPVRRDDSTSPPLFYAADQYRLWTTPA